MMRTLAIVDTDRGRMRSVEYDTGRRTWIVECRDIHGLGTTVDHDLADGCPSWLGPSCDDLLTALVFVPPASLAPGATPSG